MTRLETLPIRHALVVMQGTRVRLRQSRFHKSERKKTRLSPAAAPAASTSVAATSAVAGATAAAAKANNGRPVERTNELRRLNVDKTWRYQVRTEPQGSYDEMREDR